LAVLVVRVATSGSTTRNIAVEHRTRIGLPQTGLVARLAVTHLPTVRLVRDSRLATKAEIWPAIVAEALESVIALVVGQG